MRQLTCTSCGATLAWDGASPIVTCQFCGARFAMQSNNQAGGPSRDWRTEALKGGCIADRPVLEPGENQGKVFYRSWLPQGWTYGITMPDTKRYGLSLMTPFVPGILMISPGEDAFISHVTTNAYEESAPMVGAQGLFGGIAMGIANAFGMQQNAPGMGYGTAPNTGQSTINPFTYVRMRPLVRAQDYCDEVAQLFATHLGAQLTGVLANEEPDEFVTSRMDAVIAQLPPDQRHGLWYEWARRVYMAQMNGQSYAVVAETQVSTNGFNVMQSYVPMQHIWRTDYELVMVCPYAQLESLKPEFEKVRKSIELGRDFAARKELMQSMILQAIAGTQNTVANAQMNMAADRAASWDRRSAIIQNTHNDIMSTMHAMNANTAATADRVARWQQETIREVNTYAGLDGQPVEANIRYDHVYGYTPAGGQPNTDTYVAVEGDWLEPGVDFTELPRI